MVLTSPVVIVSCIASRDDVIAVELEQQKTKPLPRVEAPCGSSQGRWGLPDAVQLEHPCPLRPAYKWTGFTKAIYLRVAPRVDLASHLFHVI
jgi:hypothetical protein